MSGAYERDDRPIHEAFDHPGTTRRLETLSKVAAELVMSRSEVMLAWLAGGAPAIRPIVGMSTPDPPTIALSGVRLTLPAETRAKLDAAW